MTIRRVAIFGFVVMGLYGCASTPEQAPPPPARTPVAPPSAVYNHPSQQPEQPRAAPAPEYKPLANDTCGASALQRLVGKPRTEIPVPLNPSSRRVVCSSCVVTQEFRADRQTIVFDTDTGIIKSVKCG